MKRAMVHADWRLIAIINCVSFMALFTMTFLFGWGPNREHAILQSQDHEVLAALSFFISFLIGPLGIACTLWGLIMKPFIRLFGGNVENIYD